MARTETIRKDKDVLSNHIKTIKNLIGSEKFADDLIEFLDTYSTGNRTLLSEAVFDIAGKHDIIFDDDGNLDEEYADSYHASTKKSKVKKSISQDMEMYGGQINVSAGPGRGSQNWDFTDYCLELEDAEDESALDDLYEKIDRGETSFCIHRNDGWDYDIMVIKSTKKSKVAKREWAEDNYNPVSTEEQIESAFKSQYGNKEIIKLEYVGTDWEMGSQYWILMYDEGHGTLFDEDRRYSVVTVIDWTYDNPDRGITFYFGAYELHRDVAEDVFNEKVQRESNGTRKMKKNLKPKAKPKEIKMSFESNVNKIRKSNYQRIGNINQKKG